MTQMHARAASWCFRGILFLLLTLPLMAENLRSGYVWRTFMKNADVQRGLERAGFRRLSTADH